MTYLTKNSSNQLSAINHYKRINRALMVVVLILASWVTFLVYRQQLDRAQNTQEFHAITDITITRVADDSHVVLTKVPNTAATKIHNGEHTDAWSILSPYQGQASSAVVSAFIKRLTMQCMTVPRQELSRQIETFAVVDTNVGTYTIGELNTVSDKVYVQHGESLALCDKLVAAIALAPAIQFIDKRLYEGELSSITGDYGTLSKTESIDFSVLDINHVKPDYYNATGATKLTITSTMGRYSYDATISDDGKHLLLYSQEKQLMYAIGYQKALASIMGL